MPELRHDPIQGRWVIIATERSRRPDDCVRLGFALSVKGTKAKLHRKLLR